jgi:hypothetical protein
MLVAWETIVYHPLRFSENARQNVRKNLHHFNSMLIAGCQRLVWADSHPATGAAPRPRGGSPRPTGCRATSSQIRFGVNQHTVNI